MASDWNHIPVHSPSFTDIYEDPFEDNLDLTFPPLRYLPLFYDQLPSFHLNATTSTNPSSRTKRRESSKERELLYRELVGHKPYSIIKKEEPKISSVVSDKHLFCVKLDVKHYKPDEITLKVEGQSLIVTGKHYNATENGFESSEFHRKYAIPDTIDPQTLTSNITQDGVLCIEASPTIKSSEKDIVVSTENFVINLDVSGYSSDELTIRVNDRELVVHGETKDELDHNHVKSIHHQQFTRHFTLPNDVDVERLSSKFTKDCKITIEAPRGGKNIRTLETKEE